MKWVLLLLAVNALVVPGALADVNDLSDGAMIVHHAVGVEYTTDTPAEGWCPSYITLANCDAQVNEIPGTDPDVAKLWFVLGAWNEDKVCPSIQFGINYTAHSGAGVGYAITEKGPCFPGSGLELPDPTWPAPNTGTALTCTGGTNWTGNYVPLYFFWGYTYGAGTIDLVPAPQAVPPFIGFSNVDLIDAPVGEDYRGQMGLGGTPGKKVCPPPPAVPGACCFDGGNTCQFVTPVECAGLGGHFQGEGTDCDPNPCPTIWACCVVDQCYMLSQTECTETYGGGWVTGKTCLVDINCSVLHVCCVGGSTCIFVTEDECINQSGDWVTDPLFPNCTTTDCPVPVEKASWGTIKAIYR